MLTDFEAKNWDAIYKIAELVPTNNNWSAYLVNKDTGEESHVFPHVENPMGAMVAVEKMGWPIVWPK